MEKTTYVREIGHVPLGIVNGDVENNPTRKLFCPYGVCWYS